MGEFGLSVIFLQFLSISILCTIPVSCKPAEDAPNIVKFSIECTGKPTDPMVGSVQDMDTLGSSLNQRTIPRIELPKLNLLSKKPLINKDLLFPKNHVDYNTKSFFRETGHSDNFKPSLIKRKPLFPRVSAMNDEDMDGSETSVRNSLPVMPEYLQRLMPKRTDPLTARSSLLSDRSNQLLKKPLLNLKKLSNFRSANDMQALPTQEDYNARSCDICKCLMNSSPSRQSMEISKPRLAMEERLKSLVGNVQRDSLKNNIQRPSLDLSRLSNRLKSALDPQVGATNDQSVMADSSRPSFALPPNGFNNLRDPGMANGSDSTVAREATRNFGKIIDALSRKFDPSRINIPRIDIRIPRIGKDNITVGENSEQRGSNDDPKDNNTSKDLDNYNESNNANEISLPSETDYEKEPDNPKEPNYNEEQDYSPEASSPEKGQAPPRYTEEGIKNLIEFVNIVDHVDKYISDKTRHVITRLSDIYHEDLKDRVV